MAKTKPKTKKAEYSKEVILSADKLKWNRDLLNALLEDNKEYELDEVDKLVQEYNDREVK